MLQQLNETKICQIIHFQVFRHYHAQSLLPKNNGEFIRRELFEIIRIFRKFSKIPLKKDRVATNHEKRITLLSWLWFNDTPHYFTGYNIINNNLVVV